MQKLFTNNSQQNIQHAEITRLRALARSYRDANNVLVQQLWDIDKQLTENNSDEEKASLMHQKVVISQQIDESEYIRNFQTTIQQIQALEIELTGYSDVGRSSPYVL